MSGPSFDSDFEEAIIGQALRDTDFMNKAMRLCDTHHFGSPERAWLWGGIRDCWDKYREIPTAKLMLYKAKEDFPDDEKREPYLKTVARMFKKQPKAPRAALEELEKFVKFVNAQLALEKSAAALEKGDIDAAYTAMNLAVRATVGTRKYALINWIEEFEDRQSKRKYEHDHPDEVVAIPTGWPTIDKLLRGGSRPGELCGLMGTTGRGKSIALNNICHAAAGRGFNVLYVPFEMPSIQVADRQDARWLQMEYDKLKSWDLKPAELRAIKAKYDKAKKHFGTKLKIASFPIRSATIDDVHGLLEDLWAEYGWRPQMIALDSADHLRAKDTIREAFRLQQSEVYWSSKGLATEGGYVVYTSIHAGKEWAGQIAQAEGTSESYDKARIVDLLISINDPNYKQDRRKTKVESDDEDDDDGDETFEVKKPDGHRECELHVAKARDAESQRTVKAILNAKLMTIKEVEAA